MIPSKEMAFAILVDELSNRTSEDKLATTTEVLTRAKSIVAGYRETGGDAVYEKLEEFDEYEKWLELTVEKLVKENGLGEPLPLYPTSLYKKD